MMPQPEQRSNVKLVWWHRRSISEIHGQKLSLVLITPYHLPSIPPSAFSTACLLGTRALAHSVLVLYLFQCCISFVPVAFAFPLSLCISAIFSLCFLFISFFLPTFPFTHTMMLLYCHDVMYSSHIWFLSRCLCISLFSYYHSIHLLTSSHSSIYPSSLSTQCSFICRSCTFSHNCYAWTDRITLTSK